MKVYGECGLAKVEGRWEVGECNRKKKRGKRNHMVMGGGR